MHSESGLGWYSQGPSEGLLGFFASGLSLPAERTEPWSMAGQNRSLMSRKNQAQFLKRQKELERKRKADKKREMRRNKKSLPAEILTTETGAAETPEQE
jgi:hypothetical protein